VAPSCESDYDMLYSKQHVLNRLLPGTTEAKYHHRRRRRNLRLRVKNSTITERNFITRLLFKDVY